MPAITTLNIAVPLVPTLSCAWIVNAKVPAAVGVPESTPLASNVSPDGSVPDNKLNE